MVPYSSSFRTSICRHVFNSSHLVRFFSTSRFLAVKPLPPRPKLDDKDITGSYLKGSGPGGQKIVWDILPLSSAFGPSSASFFPLIFICTCMSGAIVNHIRPPFSFCLFLCFLLVKTALSLLYLCSSLECPNLLPKFGTMELYWKFIESNICSPVLKALSLSKKICHTSHGYQPWDQHLNQFQFLDVKFTDTWSSLFVFWISPRTKPILPYNWSTSRPALSSSRRRLARDLRTRRSPVRSWPKRLSSWRKASRAERPLRRPWSGNGKRARPRRVVESIVRWKRLNGKRKRTRVQQQPRKTWRYLRRMIHIGNRHDRPLVNIEGRRALFMHSTCMGKGVCDFYVGHTVWEVREF